MIIFAHHMPEHTLAMNLPVIVGVVLASIIMVVLAWRSNK